MPAADETPNGFVYTPREQQRHQLKTPLTTISGHAQLLGRTIQRSSDLTAERDRLLEAVAAIERAVREMVTLVDSLSTVADEVRSDAGGAHDGRSLGERRRTAVERD